MKYIEMLCPLKILTLNVGYHMMTVIRAAFVRINESFGHMSNVHCTIASLFPFVFRSFIFSVYNCWIYSFTIDHLMPISPAW